MNDPHCPHGVLKEFWCKECNPYHATRLPLGHQVICEFTFNGSPEVVWRMPLHHVPRLGDMVTLGDDDSARQVLSVVHFIPPPGMTDEPHRCTVVLQ